jgi:hypothetical protein
MHDEHGRHYHCAICGAEFDTKSDVETHERARHTQQGISGVSPSNDYRPASEREAERKNRKFERRHPE